MKFAAWMVAFAALLFVGCNGPKALVKKGLELENAGQIEQAANLYYAAVMKDRSHVDALASLQRAGQGVLNMRLDDFQSAVALNDRAEAVRTYEAAVAYFDKIGSVNVRLDFPERHKMAFNQVKSAHMDDLYEAGMEDLATERFNDALSKFEEIVRLDPSFRDADLQADIAYCEPRYRSGKTALSVGKYRSAYRDFDEVIGRKLDFKDAAALKDEALSQGLYTIAVIGFQNGSDRPNLENKFRTYVMQEVANSTDPFLKVVDRENQQMILQEQQLALSGMLDENTAIEVGGLLGAKALMKGTVVSYEASQTELRRNTRQGFESYRVEKVNAEGKKYYDTQYRAVTYMEFEQSREVSVTFNLALISLATGETLASEMITRSRSDAIRFAKYTGNRNNLFPANMSGTVNRSGQRELQGLLASRQELIAESSLLNEAVQESAKGIREALERNLLEIVP